MPIKVYLDSNVIMRLILEKDKDVQTILEASRRGDVEACVSWLSLTEISKSVSRMSNPSEMRKETDRVLKENNIKVLAEFDPTLSSGTISPRIGSFDYSDYLHLSIASKIGAEFFLTYDNDLLVVKKFEELYIIEPKQFRKEVLGV